MEYIGVSLALCVQDLCENRLSDDHIIKIVTNTRCYTMDDWARVIKLYKRSYWRPHGDRAEKFVRKLLMSGKIEQPRLAEGRRRVQTVARRRCWVRSEAEIIWA